mmetsp:Transcript_28040/g.66591  ORF Transcript_28040/g.66591 Transcript_28040/m.66591 type:complete len:218 (+) Transcript_28040:242-895(+)
MAADLQRRARGDGEVGAGAALGERRSSEAAGGRAANGPSRPGGGPEKTGGEGDGNADEGGCCPACAGWPPGAARERPALPGEASGPERRGAPRTRVLRGGAAVPGGTGGRATTQWDGHPEPARPGAGSAGQTRGAGAGVAEQQGTFAAAEGEAGRCSADALRGVGGEAAARRRAEAGEASCGGRAAASAGGLVTLPRAAAGAASGGTGCGGQRCRPR